MFIKRKTAWNRIYESKFKVYAVNQDPEKVYGAIHLKAATFA